MTLATDGAILATTLGALVFVVAYAWLTRGLWRNSNVGLNIMSMMAAILVTSALAVIAVFFGVDWPGREYIRFGAWLLIAVIVWWRVIILFRVQYPKRE